MEKSQKKFNDISAQKKDWKLFLWREFEMKNRLLRYTHFPTANSYQLILKNIR